MITRTGAGAILTNPEFSDTPALPEWFEPSYWAERDRQIGTASGRGAVSVVCHEEHQWVLRHYQRGGLVGRVNHDRYLYTGFDRVRAVREFVLLSQLVDWGLPTCVPVAARYQRTGLWYQADLITQFVPHQQTLADYLGATELTEESLRQVFGQVGEVIGRYQAVGVCHADLNCHNILLEQSVVSIIDLDRGRLLAPGGWQQATLKRLQRSALKVSSPQQHELIIDAWASLESAEIAARKNPDDKDSAGDIAAAGSVNPRSAPGR